MKQLLSIFIAVLVAITAFGQSSPPNKLRSNDSFTQVDNYLVAAKRLGIPSGATLTLDGSTSSADAPKLFWRTSDSTLHVYVPALSSWLPAGGSTGPIVVPDLQAVTDQGNSTTNNINTSAAVQANAFNGVNANLTGTVQTNDLEVSGVAIWADAPTEDDHLANKEYVDEQNAFNIIDVTQALYTDKAINVRPFNNTGMAYSEGSIDFGITRDSTHTMGLYAFKQGVETTASSLYSSAFGVNTTASDIASSAFGAQTTASGPYSSAFGNTTTASGYASSAFGAQTTANEFASLAIGRYSTEGAVETSWTTGSPIFKVGNGTNSGNRSNAYVLNNDGTSTQYGVASYGADYSSSFGDRSLVDKAYVDAQSVIEALDEGNGIGYRIRGRNPARFGNIGLGAVDFSNSDINSSTRGATGTSSVAFGYQTTASGLYSLATGVNTAAAGIGSTALGEGGVATGTYATAMGFNGTASGYGSVTMGTNNSAGGSNSFAVGYYNSAGSFGSMSIGRFSTVSPSEASWVDGSPLFKAGNGTSGSARRNAYVLYNDGRSEQIKDVEVTEIGQGFVLKSPDGTRWRITVDNSGVLSTTAL